tara:strand:+ start:1617 stop:2816 length:1200 start_codon:yes stop_codon:yes gene_type:complete
VLFQTLDDKKECVGYFLDGELVFDKLPDGASKTWNYAPHLADREVEYAKLYCGGRSLEEVCPENLREEWAEINKKLKAFVRSFKEARVSLQDNCFFDLVPQRFLLEFCNLKNKISQHVFANYARPQNYDFLIELIKLTEQIKENRLEINTSALKGRMAEFKVRQFAQKLNKVQHSCRYNVFGTKTGRLTTEKNSFPILTMEKEFRKVIQPKNDCFVELDFNAAELRTLLALLGADQPQQDIHEWNLENVYRGIGTRELAKKRIFAWLYNQSSRDHLADMTYNRELIKKKYWNGSHIVNPFGRLIESDEFHAVNYLVQSTASDIFLRQAIEVNRLLRGKKSFISFMIHDSLVLDFSVEDRALISSICKNFSRTKFGDFLATAKMGKNFGEMREFKWNTTS